ncbi:hypothetical protein [Bacteroides reticulotermitis]|uniref:hypothetical protein n=1 Tax=Bacteroides reticulotermitis TaxID=1133319 RepID=UPI003A88394B
MKKLNSKGIKVLKTIHLLLVMMWVTGVLAMATLYLLKPKSGDELYMVLNIILFIDWVFVIPGAILTVVVGVIYGFFTNWGFFKYRWITVKWIVAILIILAGTFYYSPLLEQSLEIADQTRDAALDNPVIVEIPTNVPPCVQFKLTPCFSFPKVVIIISTQKLSELYQYAGL